MSDLPPRFGPAQRVHVHADGRDLRLGAGVGQEFPEQPARRDIAVDLHVERRYRVARVAARSDRTRYAPRFEAIRQLTARYNLAFDEREIDSWPACFTPDASVEFVASGRLIRGHDELGQVIATTDNIGRHTTTDFIIDVDDDRATQRCHLVEFGLDGGDAVVRRYGRYEDRLQRDEGGVWRFDSRRLSYG